MKEKGNKKQNIVIYRDKNRDVSLRADVEEETLWATQAQIATLFDVNSQAVVKHLGNIYKDGELIKLATCSKMEQVQIEGNRTVKREVEFYNLDAMYRKTGERKINDNALASLALLVALSNPKEKEVIVALITNLIS